MALSAKDRTDIAELVAHAVATALAEARVASKPAKAEVASPLVDAPEGERMRATRAANLAGKVAGKHCPDCKVGFVYAKATCPRCGKSL